MSGVWQLFLSRRSEVWSATVEHLDLTLTAVILAVLFAVPLGVHLSKDRKVAGGALGAVSVVQTIPSLALLGFMLTLLGIGVRPAIVALFLYCLLPILRNTYTALGEVNPALREAARGMGMNPMQVLLKVELPLSLPVIMAGIRTATVVAVGIATLCALIGAGGLGKFIFRGIALNNSGLILLGVIPSAILALGMDFALGGAEKLLVPRGLRLGKREEKFEAPSTARRILIPTGLLAALLLVFLVLFGIRGSSRTEDRIVIGSKDFTEQLILAEMLARVVEDETGLEVTLKTGLGGTLICFGALQRGDLDLYPEYTGTGLKAILKREDRITNPNRVFRLVKKEFADRYGLTWLKPFGFNNTYALAMREDRAKALGISKISDLARHPGLGLGFTAEFIERDDGYPGMAKHYGFSFDAEPRDLDPGLMYEAVKEREVDVITAFATDGRIQAYGLEVLEDDKQFFPPYHAAPLVREETLEKYPGLGAALLLLASRIDDAAMTRLNFEVDKQGKSPSQVAEEFLREEGLCP